MPQSKSRPPLRFAALVRVSTEQQEKDGESLKVQRETIRHDVEFLKGKIVEWYRGQEHATEGWEKSEVTRLITDANKGRFDAVIVTHTDRWSRDNRQSDDGLDVFREHGIRFFVRTREYDLLDEDDSFQLGLDVLIAKRHARMQNKRSLRSRVQRAKDGKPAVGKRPFGRIWDDKAERWSVDPDKKTMIEDVAKRYLAGEQFPKLAEEYGQNPSNLWKVVTQRAGDQWEQRFYSQTLRIDETVVTVIPRLLPDKTIAAIRKRAAQNRTLNRGKGKGNRKGKTGHRYLLSGVVFCAHCGYTLGGQPPNKAEAHHYYRHGCRDGSKQCPVRPRPYIRADELEKAVIELLFETFGNPAAVKRAIEKATPNLDKINALRVSHERIVKELEKIKRGRERVIQLIADDTITDDDAKGQLARLAEKEQSLQDEATRLYVQIEGHPTPDAIKALAKKVAAEFGKPRVASTLPQAVGRDFEGMSWEDKRSLVEMVFSGVTADGRPNGVYIEPIEDQKDHRRKRWAFTLHGKLIDGEQSVTETACHCTTPTPPARRSGGRPPRPAA